MLGGPGCTHRVRRWVGPEGERARRGRRGTGGRPLGVVLACTCLLLGVPSTVRYAVPRPAPLVAVASHRRELVLGATLTAVLSRAQLPAQARYTCRRRPPTRASSSSAPPARPTHGRSRSVRVHASWRTSVSHLHICRRGEIGSPCLPYRRTVKEIEACLRFLKYTVEVKIFSLACHLYFTR